MPNADKVNMCVGMDDEMLDRVELLTKEFGLPVCQLIKQMIDLAVEANRPRLFYTEPGGTYRLPNGSRRKLKPFKVEAEVRNTIKTLARMHDCSISTVIRRELMRPDLVNQLVPKGQYVWSKHPRTPNPVKIKIGNHWMDDGDGEILDVSPMITCNKCHGWMLLRERRKDYYCCQCRNAMPLNHGRIGEKTTSNYANQLAASSGHRIQ